MVYPSKRPIQNNRIVVTHKEVNSVNIVKTIELYTLGELYGMWIISQQSCYEKMKFSKAQII